MEHHASPRFFPSERTSRGDSSNNHRERTCPESENCSEEEGERADRERRNTNTWRERSCVGEGANEMNLNASGEPGEIEPHGPISVRPPGRYALRNGPEAVPKPVLPPFPLEYKAYLKHLDSGKGHQSNSIS